MEWASCMRVISVTINKLAPFVPQFLDLSEADSLGVFVGPNGSGKSRLSTYISIALSALGANGPRGYSSPDGLVDIEVGVDFADELRELRDIAKDLAGRSHIFQSSNLTWQGKAQVHLRVSDPELGLEVESSGDGIDQNEWMVWREAIQKTENIRVSMIDANRAFSRAASLGEINRARAEDFRNVAENWSQNWATADSDNVFVHWFTLLYSMEQRELNRANAERMEGGDGRIHDPFKQLNKAIASVVGEIKIKGSGTNGELQFGGDNHSVIFQQLSGGEREVIYLLTLAELHSIKNGILIIDEPELHLHPLLLRRMLAVISERNPSLQLLISSHSYEAAEAALNRGRLYSFSADNGAISIFPVDPGSAYQHLVTILGTPGLGLSSTLFVAVEGAADSLRSPARFETNTIPDHRIVFLRAGSGKKQVTSLIDSLKGLASSRGEPLHIIGIVDGDYSSMGGETVFNGILSIGVHEVENLYLEPVWLDSFAKDLCPGLDWDGAELEIRRFAKENAGTWVFQYASEHHRKEWLKLRCVQDLDDLKPKLEALTWEQLVSNDHHLQTVMSGIGSEPRSHIVEAIRIYARVVEDPDIWKHCKGKLILTGIARRLGFSGDRTKLEIELDRYRVQTAELELEGWGKVQQFLDIQLMQLSTPRNTQDRRA